MLLDDLMIALGYPDHHARYERLKAARQRAVAIDKWSDSGFHRTEINDFQVPPRRGKLP